MFSYVRTISFFAYLMEYKFSEIEKKWQKFWEENQIFRVENNSPKPKFYVLDMFPYPSGAGLHVGHPLGYIASDIYSRYKRLKGFNVLHPMGFDAFGLPAEQYAIETGQHPAITTEKNIQRYKEQLQNIGFCFDWSREIKTCDPHYYKWTQWIFLKLFNSWYNPETNKAEDISTLIKMLEDGRWKMEDGKNWNAFSEKEKSDFLLNYRLAYLAYSDVNWCPALGTVLANDEVKDGKSERGGHPVIRKKMRQWFLRITAYADRLLYGLDNLDWSPQMKEMQRNWIGRSEGALIRFPLVSDKINLVSLTEENPNFVKKLYEKYGTIPQRLSPQEERGRTEGGSFHVEATIVAERSHPSNAPINSPEKQTEQIIKLANEQYIEVFTTRPDTIFGATFIVIAPEHELVEKITTPTQKLKIQKYLEYVQSRSDVERQQEKTVTGEFTGAYAINPFTNKKIPIWIAEYVLAGYGTGAIMAVPSDDDRDNAFAQKFGLEIIDVIDKSKYPGSTRDDKKGIMINSGFLNGMEVPDAIETIIKKVEEMQIGKRKVNYKMRDAGFSRQRYWGEPFPIVYKNGIPDCLDEKDLPVILPEVESYKPTGDGESPLATNSQWKNLPDGSIRETDTMPGYAGSSWYYLRYMDPKNEKEFVGKNAEQYWKNVDLYIGGSEHAVGHLLYARFWHKVLFDLGYVSTEEPFQKLINQGMIQGRSNIVYRINGENKFVSQGLRAKYNTTALHVDVNIVENDILDLEKFKNWREEFSNAEFILEDGKYYCGYEIEKMSKRWHNVVNPDDVVAKYGADCFRMYEMFLGPIEQHKPWDTKGIEGVFRFLKKFWKLFHSPFSFGEGQGDEAFSVSDENPNETELKILHKTIKKIQDDTERFSFNTAVSNFMICINELTEIKCNKRKILEPLVILIAPYAPHFAEELWEKLGNKPSVNDAQFPQFEEKYLVENVFTYPVSFNGKVRFKIDLSAALSIQEIEKAALENEQAKKWLEGKSPKKVIVVPKKIVNVVV